MEARGDAAFGHGSIGRDVLLTALGIITAVPLLLFAAAATRIPLSLLGLLQYLTPTGQHVALTALKLRELVVIPALAGLVPGPS